MDLIKEYQGLNYNEYLRQLNSHILIHLKNEKIFNVLINLDANHIYKKNNILIKAMTIGNIEIVKNLLEKFDYTKEELKNAFKIIITKDLDIVKKCWEIIKNNLDDDGFDGFIKLTNYIKLKNDVVEYFISEGIFKIPTNDEDLINLIKMDAKYLLLFYIDQKKIDIKKFEKNGRISKCLLEKGGTMYYSFSKYFVTYKSIFQTFPIYNTWSSYRLFNDLRNSKKPTDEEREMMKEYYKKNKNTISFGDKLGFNSIFGLNLV